MENVTFTDISLSEYSLANLDIVNAMRNAHFNNKSEICIERARLLTDYYKNEYDPSLSVIINRAKAMEYILSRKKAVFHPGDKNQLAGTTTTKPLGAPLYPEYFALTIWPELETIGKRKKNPQLLSGEDADVLNLEVFPYWMEKCVIEVVRKKYDPQNNLKSLELFEQFINFIAGKMGCITHTVPGFSGVLESGLLSISNEAAYKENELAKNETLTEADAERMDFYKAIKIVCCGIIAYAGHCADKAKELSLAEQDPVRKKILEKLSAICRKVPASPAESYHEAVESLWLCYVAMHVENPNIAMSPGRLDYLLYKYYKHDMEAGTLTVREALEITASLWFKFADNVILVPEASEEYWGGAGAAPAVTLGGIDEQGEDAVSDLTYIMLKVTELVNIRDPSMNARYHFEKNSPDYLNRVTEVIVRTKAVPAFHNDVIDMKILQNQGVSIGHARDYAIIGCVELGVSGRSYDSSGSIMLNLAAPLELAIYNGRRPHTGDKFISFKSGEPEAFQTFDEFYNAFKSQTAWIIKQAIELNEYAGRVHMELLPTPLLSLFYEGTMKSGRDLISGGALYNSSGATHIGFADVVDSLLAIRTAVFIDRRCTFNELITVLKNDFKDDEDLRLYLVNKTPHFGSEDESAREIASELIRFLYDTYQSYTNYRGGKYRPAFWTMTQHSGLGRLNNALPNGRKKGESFASGITPVSQHTSDVTGCLNDVAELPYLCIPGGEALNLKFTSVNTDDDVKKLSHLVETYFRKGGLQVQFNIMSYEMLKNAYAYFKSKTGKTEKRPEFERLLVRVSGYSAYFGDLNDQMQKELIARTEYDIKTGKAVRFSGF